MHNTFRVMKGKFFSPFFLFLFASAMASGFFVSAGCPTCGMKCADGTVLSGDTGPEMTLTKEMFCKMFPKFPWQYPILGYKAQNRGVQYPNQCQRQLGGWVYTSTCPAISPEQIHQQCLSSSVPNEIIRDMACVVKRDPAKLGRFLANKNQTRNKFEVASFLAHVGQETGDLRTMWENDGYEFFEIAVPGREFRRKKDVLVSVCQCSNAGQYCDYFYGDDNKYCTAERKFFGRGVHQLTHPSNYADFSAYWFKDRTFLLENPDKLLDDMETAWASAIWFWMDPRTHHNGDPYCAKKTLMHDSLFNELGFGQTISAINGGIECSGSNRFGPWQRIGRVIYFLDVLGVPMPWADGTLKAIPKWFTEGCSYINTYKLKVRRAAWREVEGNGECKGYNQPYLCGWGGLQNGPSSVPQPLVSFDTGGGVTSVPPCVKNFEPSEKGQWPHNLIQDQGYLPIGGGGGGSSSGGGDSSGGGSSGGGDSSGGGSSGGGDSSGGSSGGGSDSSGGGSSDGGDSSGGGSIGGGGLDDGKCQTACVDRCYRHVFG